MPVVEKPRNCSNRGQSTVEFALIVPVLLLLVLAITQVGIVAAKKVWLSYLARETVRVLAHDVDADIESVIGGVSRNAADPNLGFHMAQERISDSYRAVTVELVYTYRVVGLADWIPAELELRSQASMLLLE